ncbi:MAG: hypothetical protein GY862_12615, partial [Gammaproteobacteria bacterium]|nr:hypothetical protein [Gammaproteobacteria bacterium]
MADKYLQSSGGAHQEAEGLTTSAGASDSGKIPALDAAGKLHVSMIPAGVGQDVKLILAYEALAAGAFINIYDNAGAANCRLASAAVTDKEAHGFVLAGVADGENAQVYFEGE